MDADEFRKMGHEMVEFIAGYMENINSMPVFPDVKPGFLVKQLPSSAPEEGEQWDEIYEDVNKFILPGSVQWNSRHFHAYFPSITSCESLLGDMLSSAVGGVGFTWTVNPAMTELEIVVMDWIGKMLHLPEDFLFSSVKGDSSGPRGGGSIQGSASEALLVSMLAARTAALERLRLSNPGIPDAVLMSRLIAYASDQVHSSLEKDATISCVSFKLLPSDKHGSLHTDTFERAIEADKAAGLFPFFLCATLGSTSSCAMDDIVGLGPVCNKENIWLHIDAAYLGLASICPEYRNHLNGVEFAQAFNTNCTKFFQISFDCSLLWIKDRDVVSRGFGVQERTYYTESESGSVTDFKNWQISLGRRFRSLKLWFLLRHQGVKGMQAYMRKVIKLAKYFEDQVRMDSRFEIVTKRVTALVCFRLKASNEINRALVEEINKSGKIYLTPSTLHEKYFIRMSVGHPRNTEQDIDFAWDVIRRFAAKFDNAEPQKNHLL